MSDASDNDVYLCAQRTRIVLQSLAASALANDEVVYMRLGSRVRAVEMFLLLYILKKSDAPMCLRATIYYPSVE